MDVIVEQALPGPEGDRAGVVPAARALGRLDRARFAGLAEARRAPLHARSDDVLQLRVGVRPARLRRPRDAGGPQVRGQSRTSGIARTQLRQGPGHAESGERSRSDSLSAETRRKTWR